MESDEVNSINDTSEAEQVARIIRSSYFDIVSEAKLPRHFSTFSLGPLSDATRPTLMYRPDSIQLIQWLKYDKRENSTDQADFQELDYLELDEFLERTYQYDTTLTTADSFDYSIGGDTVTLFYKNDIAPSAYTIIGGATVAFDSIDLSISNTLEKSKTLGYGLVTADFSLINSFVPDLDDYQFPLLLNEAKATAFLEMKQVNHVKAERNARKHWVRLQKNKNLVTTDSPIPGPNYGRVR